jgi:hypothetical protein
MRWHIPIAAALVLLSLPLPALAQQQPPSEPAVKVGDPAPAFSLKYLAPTPDGKVQQQTVSLGDFKGKKTVILAFFPAAFSPG